MKSSTGPRPADVAALKPIWTISGTATAALSGR